MRTNMAYLRVDFWCNEDQHRVTVRNTDPENSWISLGEKELSRDLLTIFLANSPHVRLKQLSELHDDIGAMCDRLKEYIEKLEVEPPSPPEADDTDEFHDKIEAASHFDDDIPF